MWLRSIIGIAVLGSLTLSGCADPTFTHPTKPAQAQQTDQAECMALAGQAGSGWGMLMTRERRRQTTYRACMEGRGYTLAE